jgi:hypothetical protein
LIVCGSTQNLRRDLSKTQAKNASKGKNLT